MTETNLKDLEEVWASTTGGTAWVFKHDPRRPGNWVEKFIGGAGDVKLRLTIEEREYNQDLVAWGNEHLCPFRNGTLVRILPKEVERGQFELTDAELSALIKGGSDDEFQDMIDKTSSEVVLRRMLSIAASDKSTSIGRLEGLVDVIKERFPQGRGSQFVEEIREHEARVRSLPRL